MGDTQVPSDWQELTHRLVDGEWVMTYATPDGRVVDASGDHVPPSEYQHEPYVSTVIVDSERFHQREDGTGDGVVAWYDDDGNPVPPVETADATSLPVPGTIHVHDGAVYRNHVDDTGTTIVLDADGDVASITLRQLLDEPDVPTFVGLAEVDGRRVVIATDDAGDTHLYTPQGDRIDRPIDPSSVDRVDPGALAGDPISIGEHALADGTIADVLLFPDGSQAIIDADGNYERVIVPTDAEYPRGREFFEGTIESADGRTHDVYSFADGQTAMEVDGELVLIDVPIESTHPGEAPVACGSFPGGDLFVFPDGRQLLRADDGSWALGDLPDVPPFDQLVAIYGESDVDDPDDDDGDGIGSLDPTVDRTLDLADDITSFPSLDHVAETTAPDASLDDGVAPDLPDISPVDPPSIDPNLGSVPTPLADIELPDDPITTMLVEELADDAELTTDPADDSTF